MRFTIPSLVVTLLGLASLGARAADEAGPPTPAEKYEAIVKAEQKAREEFSKAYQAAKTDEERRKVSKEFGSAASSDRFAGQLLALIREYPRDLAAFDAFLWLNRHASLTETPQAADVLIREWIADERLEKLCQSLYYHASESGERILRAAIEKSPHRAVQGHARFSLAVALSHRAERLVHQRPEDREPLEREALGRLQEVIDKYADVKHFTTLGREAEALRFELQHLGIGKTPPDIAGQDLDGKELKLSEYRGKVTLIVFWATWCGPCMGEIPHERELLDRYAGKPFAIVGVNGDKDRDKARTLGAKAGANWRSFWDGDGGPITAQWNVHAWPTLYLLDGRGVVRYKGGYLRTVSARKKNGKTEQYSFLDDAVEALVKEAEARKP